MRTKTPKQIAEQAHRLTLAVALKKDAQTKQRLERISAAFEAYIDRIYDASGVGLASDVDDKVWNNYAVPASVYAKQV